MSRLGPKVKEVAKNATLKFLYDDRGSLSVLIMSLFMASLLTLFILTDISSVYIAKRALTQSTEAAAQRGARNLNYEAYYSSKYNALTFIENLTPSAQQDPGIPIDCSKGRADAESSFEDLREVQRRQSGLKLESMQIERFECDGFQIALETSAEVALPFQFPFINLEKIHINSSIGTFDERKITTNYYGIDIP